MSHDALNFNDARIALACRSRSIPAIAGFNTDFDMIPWLTRLSNAEEIGKHGEKKHGYFIIRTPFRLCLRFPHVLSAPVR